MAVSLPKDIPYDDKTANEIQNFYKFSVKKPNLYRISESGTLETYKKDGSLEKSISLKPYRPITSEERNVMEDFRLQQLAALDILFEEQRNVLRKAIELYKSTGIIGPVLQANQDVRDIELRRVKMRSAIRSIKDIPMPKTNEILFDQPNEQRKIFGDYNLFGRKDVLAKGLVALERRNFPNSLYYGRYEEPGTDTTSVAAEGSSGVSTAARATLTSGVSARLFYEPDDEQNGFLSPAWPAKLVYNGTEYASAYQAYEATRAEMLGNKDVRAAILKTRSERTIRLLAKKVKGKLPNIGLVWTPILTALYEQHPELVGQLISTGQDVLIYADPEVGAGGVGRGIKDKKVLDPASWQSENIVGKVLESLRARFREGVAPVAPVEEAEEKVISEAEQATAKKAAIIQARIRGKK